MYLHDSSRTFGVLGIPLDSIDLRSVLHNIDEAAIARRRLLLSTVNANFLVASQHSHTFRKSLLASDLCTVDGVAVVVLCRLLGLGKMPRTSGADILKHLCARSVTNLGRPLRVFFFGGDTGVAERAGAKINDLGSQSVLCVGTIDPGFGSVETMSRSEWIDQINEANPDILILALGAERGQAWLLHNADRLTVPVRTHFGAALNFLAGTVKRAPSSFQRCGMEWLWRILQEPYLARRYCRDGLDLVRLTLCNVLPLALMLRLDQCFRRKHLNRLVVDLQRSNGDLAICLRGTAGAGTMPVLRTAFNEALDAHGPVTLDLGALEVVDLHGIGAMMRLRRDLESRGLTLRLKHVPPRITRRFKLAAVQWAA